MSMAVPEFLFEETRIILGKAIDIIRNNEWCTGHDAAAWEPDGHDLVKLPVTSEYATHFCLNGALHRAAEVDPIPEREYYLRPGATPRQISLWHAMRLVDEEIASQYPEMRNMNFSLVEWNDYKAHGEHDVMALLALTIDRLERQRETNDKHDQE